MYKPFLHILFYLLPCALRAQENLVPNPSFENFTQCPENREDFGNLNAWYPPNLSTPDIYHTCLNVQTITAIPQNEFGWQWPRTGDAYVGFHSNPPDVREYVQCELTETLEAGELYAVGFYVSHADSSTTTCDNIAALLTETAVFSNNSYVLNYTPQIVSPLSQPVTDDIGWVQVTDTIMANGTEKYLTIGVFSNDANTTWETVEGGWDISAYYYIDDVSVVQIVNTVTIPNVFTPNGDGVNDVLEIGNTDHFNGELTVYDRWGRKIFSSSERPLEWDGQINGQDAHSGVYFITVEMDITQVKNTVKKGFVHLLR